MLHLSRRARRGALFSSSLCVGTLLLLSALCNQPSWAASSATSASGTIFVCPAGDGPTLASQGLTITVTLEDAGGDPIAGFPFEDIWVGDCGSGDMALCAGGSVADANTNANGMTTISGALAAGGCAQGGLCVYVAGSVISGSVLPIDVVSPDLNGDLSVDLLDVAAFVNLYFSGNYEFCVDFDGNSDLNMCDMALFLEHQNHVCP
jgi:hypothetical protein